MQVKGIADDIQGVIFDMDGLLINSEKLYWDANIQAAEEEKIGTPWDAYLKLTGATVKEMQDFYHKYFKTEADRDRFIKRTDDLVWQWTDEGKLKLQPGVQEALDEFQKRNLRMAIASSNYEDVLQHALWATGVRNYFDFYLSYLDVQKGHIKAKPAPDIYLAAAKKMGLPKKNILVFEDSSTGVQAAASAGLKCIMVPDLISPTEQDKENAIMICQNFFEFLKKI
ncbi:HAD family phosphatase [Lactobacillus kefiranofaciens subsp. kefirgranum]|uniref:HAD family hydrolase n=1 Tax=Lactobacillus kefiranofaciens TaxID=267818 RepID=UPI00202FE031|nr:HAD family phosphatase [Lactobacillus kefiranofaciens]URW72237.1 HAD family phosphatase [Lactobacillus kefiranofaciens subsp. kefirgranum]URW74168.1 HAD family phosphatase [Lactobacillus kefiranofaciens subsp. kefirgranum]